MHNVSTKTIDWRAATWQEAMREAITDPRELLQELELDADLLAGAVAANRLFSLRVPRGFVARMRRGDAGDPLLRQVLPLGAEAVDTPHYLEDPVGDRASMRAPGVLQKYHGRVLLIATGVCAVNCRYCFRRHFPYHDANAAGGRWRAALDFIRADAGIVEVILSGGDPLTLATAKLGELTHALAGIAHVKRLRIHSRIPVVLPERVDGELEAWLARLPLQKVIVIHANHAQELDTTVDTALARLASTGAVLLNQSVLLAGINDRVAALEALGERLFAAGVMPYYLHLLDPVKGAAHFAVDEARARALHRALRVRQSGYLVPKLVREVAGEPYKVPVL